MTAQLNPAFRYVPFDRKFAVGELLNVGQTVASLGLPGPLSSAQLFDLFGLLPVGEEGGRIVYAPEDVECARVNVRVFLLAARSYMARHYREFDKPQTQSPQDRLVADNFKWAAPKTVLHANAQFDYTGSVDISGALEECRLRAGEGNGNG